MPKENQEAADFVRAEADSVVPTAEAPEEADDAVETAFYECAFHILPTVADAEAPSVFRKVKSLIAQAGGAVTEEEIAGQRDLAYEIVKQVGGTNRKFNAAHFCWVRCTLAPAALPALVEEIGRMPEVLRHLVIRLTRDEARRPFFMREALGGGAGAEDDEAEENDVASGNTDVVEALPTAPAMVG